MLRYQLFDTNGYLSYQEWLTGIQYSTAFCSFFVDILRDCPFDGYFWETIPTTVNELNQPFEFVLVNSDSLPDITADGSSFEKYFVENKDIVIFIDSADVCTMIQKNLKQKKKKNQIS